MLYLIDYGLRGEWMDRTTHTHIPEHRALRVVGTPRYTSIVSLLIIYSLSTSFSLSVTLVCYAKD